jgi:outer membrane protein assembly complex protein YaeT
VRRRGLSWWITRTWRLLLASALAVIVAGCHEAGDVRVISLALDGVKSIKTDELKRVLATRASGRMPWSVKRYFDRKEFEGDLRRITAFYADHGFPDARVSGVDVAFNEKKDGVRLRITVEEGEPVIVEDIRFFGLDALPPSAQEEIEHAPLKTGGRRGRDLVRATRDQAVRVFRNNGFPAAVVDATERPGSGSHSVVVSYFADSGPAMTFGPVSVAGVERLDESVVRREVAFTPGEPYDERLITTTQRRLAGLELLELAAVTPRVDRPEGAAVPVRITVAEGKLRRLRLGIGYGSEELARGTIQWQHLNFLGGARLFTADAKWSAIDRGAKVSLTTPYLFRPGLSLTVSGGYWITNQLTFDSKAHGGQASLVYVVNPPAKPRRQPVHYRSSVTYSSDYLRYGIKPDALGDHSRREERIALGLDPDTGRARGTLAAIDFDFERVALDNGVEPRLGTSMSVHYEFASPALGGTYKFSEVGGEVRGFVPIGPIVAAARARASTLVAKDPLTVPFAKRYFLGGSASLRGWGRFQVSPLNPDGLPIGGRSVLEFSTELRIPVRGPISAVLFVDGGNVWAGPSIGDLNDLRWDVGAGLRYRTPVGPLRVDFGRQLTPIDGLVVNGTLATRQWRLHFNIGQSF